MPYFVYKITPGSAPLIKHLELLHTFEAFKEAKDTARSLRARQGPDAQAAFKVIFAASPLEAEERLQEQREAPVLMEWEK